MNRIRRIAGVVLCPLAFTGAVFASAAASAFEAGYYRWPALHVDTLVFASEGDLWRSELGADGHSGTPAVRLTTHEELESHPVLSPDGKTLVFVARYESAGDLYAMPSSGGKPRRLTFENGGVAAVGWFDADHVLYVSGNVPGPRAQRIKRLHTATGVITTLPLADANLATMGSQGQALFFNRFGLALSSDNAVHYRGGRMAQLWRWPVSTNSSTPSEAIRLLADFAAPVRAPMWWDGRVYFVSDKSGADNLWSVAADGSGPKQHTSYTSGQLATPVLHNGRVAYQRGADIFLHDIASNEQVKLALELISDRDQLRPRWLSAPLDYMESARIGSAGASVTFTARGHAVRAFAGTRRRIEYALAPTARARAAVTVDNTVDNTADSWTYSIIDDNAVSEIWRFPADGTGSGQRLVGDIRAHLWSVQVSPGGTHLAFDDKLGRLWLLDLATLRKTQIASSESADDHPFSGFSWSPAGRYLAFSGYGRREVRRVHVVDTQTGDGQMVTSEKYESHAPAFSHDGKWLYFASDRHFDPAPGTPWGDRNMGPAFDKRSRLFALQLDPAAAFPFAPAAESLAETAKGDKESRAAKRKRKQSKTGSADKEEASRQDATILFDGLAERLWPMPVAPDNVLALAANEKFVYALAGTDPDKGFTLTSIKLESVPGGGKAETTVLAPDLTGFELTHDGKTLLLQRGKQSGIALLLVPASDKLPDELDEHTVRIADWRLRIDPAAEWRQQLLDAWRLHRDFAYDSNLRGLDWPAVLAQRLPLLDRVGHRDELTDLMKQMTAELGILHSQVGTGDLPRDLETGTAAFLGAELVPVRDGLSIQTIYQGEADLPETLGPLLQPGVDVEVGEVITAVDGSPVKSLADIARSIATKAMQQVRLELKNGRQRHSVLVTPVDAGGLRRLRYGHWVQQNAERVARLSDQGIGYLHLNAMGSGDVASFARDFYAQLDKGGMIIDVRGNRGGNVDSWLLNALQRRAWAFWQPSQGTVSGTNMQQAYRGHVVVLINEGTYSDGETFAAGAKALGLAELVGSRTAGAGIWLSDRNRLSDRGIARVAEFPQYAMDGSWLLEGRGVSPDVPVENLPVALYGGRDAQIETAVARLQAKLKTDPVAPLRARPLPPVGVPGEDVKRLSR